MLRVAEITTSPDPRRLAPAIDALRGQGIDIEFESVFTTEANFEATLAEACKSFDQIRFGGTLCSLAPGLSPRMPSLLLSLKAADAFVKQNGEWWPRNFLYDGITRALVRDDRKLDLSGAVFILGATCETRATVASLARLGFNRFTIADIDDPRGQSFVEELRGSYFNVQFQYVARQFITQLPSVHSVAVNTMSQGEDDGALGELFYFNFLSPSGIWLDLALWPYNGMLETEARAVGALVESGLSAAAWTDCEWAHAAFGAKLDYETLFSGLRNAYAPAKSDV